MKKFIFSLFLFVFSFILFDNVKADTLIIDRNYSLYSDLYTIYDYYYNNSDGLDYLNNAVNNYLPTIYRNNLINYKRMYMLSRSNYDGSTLLTAYFIDNDYVFSSYNWNKYSTWYDNDFIVKSYDNNNNVVYMPYYYKISCIFDNNSKEITSFLNYPYYNQSEQSYLSNSYFLYSDVPITIDYTNSPYDSVNLFGNLIIDNVIFYKDVWGGSKMPHLYNVKFNFPSGSNFTLKDSLGNVLTSNDDNTYSLESGVYTYSVSKSNLYIPKENIELVVNDDMEINIELVSRLNLSNYNNIFNIFYGYIVSLVPLLFGLDNPFFLIILSVSILIIIFLSIKKFLKGRF